MTKDEFKQRWESDDVGGGITFDDIAECAKEWGIAAHPCTQPMLQMRYLVLKAANTSDCENFKVEEDV